MNRTIFFGVAVFFTAGLPFFVQTGESENFLSRAHGSREKKHVETSTRDDIESFPVIQLLETASGAIVTNSRESEVIESIQETLKKAIKKQQRVVIILKRPASIDRSYILQPRFSSKTPWELYLFEMHTTNLIQDEVDGRVNKALYSIYESYSMKKVAGAGFFILCCVGLLKFFYEKKWGNKTSETSFLDNSCGGSGGRRLSHESSSGYRIPSPSAPPYPEEPFEESCAVDNLFCL